MRTNNKLAIRMALRYLWARKAHSAVTAIAIAGVCGVAVATMAIVCVLSVFNGFQEAILGRDSRIVPDLSVTPASGALIRNADSLGTVLSSLPEVETFTPVVKDEAVAYFNGHQLPINILGVDQPAYRLITAIDSITVSGKWKPQPQDVVDAEVSTEDPTEVGQIAELASEEFDESALFAEADLAAEMPEMEVEPLPSPVLVSRGVAANLGMPPGQETALMLFLPRRTGDAAFSDPASSFMVDSLAVTGVFSSEQAEFDAATVIMDIDVARRLLEYDTQANALYIKLKKGVDAKVGAKAVASTAGSGYKVSDRSQLQGEHFRMVAIEKWITFCLLGFILLIASFNIISTISILIVEKRRNIRTLSCLGAPRRFVGRVFFFESLLVCMLGSMAGVAVGLLLCWLQQQFGFISMPGDGTNLILQSYPVSVKASDIGVISGLSLLIALFTAMIAAGYASRTARRVACEN